MSNIKLVAEHVGMVEAAVRKELKEYPRWRDEILAAIKAVVGQPDKLSLAEEVRRTIERQQSLATQLAEIIDAGNVKGGNYSRVTMTCMVGSKCYRVRVEEV